VRLSWPLSFWAERPTWLRGFLLGFFAALAALSKFTSLGYIAVTVSLTLACYLAVRRPAWDELSRLARQRASTFALALFTAAVVIWRRTDFPSGSCRISASTCRLPTSFAAYLRSGSTIGWATEAICSANIA
jgi:hypothetical protein